MLNDVIDLLDRQYKFFKRRGSGRESVVQLGPLIEALYREPRLRGHLDDMLVEARAEHERFVQADNVLLDEVTALRARVPTDPSLDGTNATAPDAEVCGLHLFDGQRAHTKLPQFAVRFDLDGCTRTMSGTLIDLLRDRLECGFPARHAEPPRALIRYPSSVGLMKRACRTLATRHELLLRAFHLRILTSGAFALVRLRIALCQLNPHAHAAPSADLDPANPLFVTERIVGSAEALRELALSTPQLGTETLNGAQVEVVKTVRDATERLYEELRARVGTVRSQRALIERFKERAEAYDFAELSAIADDHRIKRKEDVFVDRLARFLFDQGLTPLTRPMIARLSPDVIAPDLYVEAKQYANRPQARSVVRNGAKQVWDTFNRQRGTPQEVREAYLVVFRRGGPTIIFDDEWVRVGSATLHVVLVDIAPTTKSGSRQREIPVRIGASDLIPGVTPPRKARKPTPKPTPRSRTRPSR